MKPRGAQHEAAAAGEALLARRVASAPAGEAEEAESELYRRLAPRVRLYGLRHLRDPQAAADLVQEVLLMTLERLRAGRIREPERLGSFVLGMCRMVVRDQRRKSQRHQRLLSQFGDSLPVADASVAPDLDRERLDSCLARLAERDRTVIVMAFGVERSAEEIGRELGISAAHIRVIRHRALVRLRECMTGKASR